MAEIQRCLKVGRTIQGSFNLVATNNLGEATKATPAISDRQIFLRTDGHCGGEFSSSAHRPEGF